VGIAAILMATVIVLVKEPRLGFPGAWFFITLSPTSSIVPIANEVGRECRMYLPMVGVVALAVVGSAIVWDRVRRAWPGMPMARVRPRAIGAAALLLVSAALGAATFDRNRDYRSTITLYQTMVDRWPTGRTRQILGVELIRAGRHAEALPLLRAAADAVPWARHDLGIELVNAGKFDEGVEHLQKMLDIWASPPASHPHWQKPLRLHAVSARTTIGIALARQQRWQEAAEQYQLALTINPNHLDAINGLAEALLRQGAFDEAAARYRDYLKSRPNDAGALSNFGVALVGSGHLDDAIAAFRQAASLDPGQGERHLANALFDKGDMEQALVHARQAVAARPDDPWAHDVLGRALAVHGQYDEAMAQFERALRIDPAHQEAREHLARVRAVARR
jgi:tetratricopeptide (TPR) repeat protein